ncbi:MAG: cytochrome c family protein, partial [Acidobacteria bacterium]|nr:cytochrome c family protein [Acidobacteriota bacterium]
MSTTRHIVLGALAWLCVAAAVAPLSAQGVGKLLSPGPLSKAHAKLEGIGSCEKCHEPGKGISAKKCLGCHRPIAKRMASKSGVHRDVGDDCVACHVEHAGRDADIRPLDKRDFDHLEETGFALDGLHEKVAKDCSKCHKTRSYLELTPDCASCHKDVHKGALGIGCVGCHSTTASFRDTGLAFDHNTA